jgi:hypothetical protein
LYDIYTGLRAIAIILTIKNQAILGRITVKIHKHLVCGIVLNDNTKEYIRIEMKVSYLAVGTAYILFIKYK